MKSGKKTSGAEANGGSRSVKRLVGPGPDICKEARMDGAQSGTEVAYDLMLRTLQNMGSDLGIARKTSEQEALEDARQLLADIANHKVNPEDEAEKWLRAYGWPNEKLSHAVGSERGDGKKTL